MKTLLLTCAQTDPAADTRFTVILLVLAALTLITLIATGILSGRAFQHAPKRNGKLNLADLGIGIGLLFVGAFVVGGMAAGILENNGETPAPSDTMLRMLIGQAGMLPVVIFILWRGGNATQGGVGAFGLGFGQPRASLAVMVLGCGAIVLLTMATSILLYLLLILLGVEPPRIAHEALVALLDTNSPGVKWALIVSAIGLAPLFEEIIFRGLLQTGLQQSGLVRGRWVTIVIASGLFAVIHFSPIAWHTIPALFVLAVGLGYAYERTGSLWPPIFIHAAFNALNVWFVLSGMVKTQ